MIFSSEFVTTVHLVRKFRSGVGFGVDSVAGFGGGLSSLVLLFGLSLI